MNINIEHPARNYIAFLLSQRRFKVNELVAQLMRQNMPVPREEKVLSAFMEILQLAQRGLQFPAGYDPTNLKHQPTSLFLHAHRIYDLWAREPHVMFAIDILDQPSVRRELEIMLLGPLNYRDIAKRLAIGHGLDPEVMNISTVRYYAHYFWNIEAVPMTKWPILLEGMPNSIDYSTVFLAPRSQVGAALSVFIASRGAGGVPKESIMFRYVRDTSFMEFIKLTATRYPGMQKATAMQALVNSLIAAQEQVDMRRGGSAELLDELRKMDTKFDPKRLTSVEELPLYNMLEAQNTEKGNAS
jgi:hypothetical protein